MRKKKLVYGIAINDAKEPVVKKIKENGVWKRVWQCPAHIVWYRMLTRAFDEKFKQKHPTYQDVTVCDRWLSFSSFKLWWEEQPKAQDLELDKDILVMGNKEYGPDTCVLIPSRVNNLFIDRAALRGEWPIGVCKDGNAFKALIGGGSGKRQKYIGRFKCPKEAHRAWQRAKISSIVEVISWYKDQEYFDQRVEEALENRMQIILADLDSGRETFKL